MKTNTLRTLSSAWPAATRVALCAAMCAQVLGAQAAAQQGAPLPGISPEAQLALDDLSPRFSVQVPLVQGWFRERPVLYYDFGTVPQPITTPKVFWPVHGFDASGNPVAMRNQRPVFSTIPAMAGYSGLWRLVYVIAADKFQPNGLKDVASIEAAVKRGRASMHETDVTLNMPIVPRGSRLERDSSAATLGWFMGRDVQYFDFGQVQASTSPMWRFALGADVGGQPNVLKGQNSLVDSIPVAGGYPDLWSIMFVRVDTSYVPNAVKSVETLNKTALRVDAPSSVRNLPITFVDGAPVVRTPGPITRFADLRSPFPPTPTLPH